MKPSAEQVKLFANGLQNEILQILFHGLFYDFEKITRAGSSKKQKSYTKPRKVMKTNNNSPEASSKRQRVQKEYRSDMLRRLGVKDSSRENIHEDLEKINKLNEDFRNQQLNITNDKECNLVVSVVDTTDKTICGNNQHRKEKKDCFAEVDKLNFCSKKDNYNNYNDMDIQNLFYK